MSTVVISNDLGESINIYTDISYDEYQQSGRCFTNRQQRNKIRKKLRSYRLPSVGKDINGKNILIN